MVTLLSGLVGGLVATVVMSMVMMTMGGGPPPTAALLAKFRGGEPEAYKMPGMLLHLLYGTVAGAVLVVAVSTVAPGITSLTAWVGIGLAYGIVLLLGGAMGWVKGVIGLEPDKQMMVGFAVVHIVYGLVLGAWLGVGVLG